MSNYIIQDKNTLNEWVAFYEKTSTFPKKKVPCSVTGAEVTMFGNNLTKRVEKFGGPRELLLNFKCREAKRHEKGSKQTQRSLKKMVNVSVDVDSTKPRSSRKLSVKAIPVPSVEQLMEQGAVSAEISQLNEEAINL